MEVNLAQCVELKIPSTLKMSEVSFVRLCKKNLKVHESSVNLLSYGRF